LLISSHDNFSISILKMKFVYSLIIIFYKASM
jgi:hypothetical protein